MSSKLILNEFFAIEFLFSTQRIRFFRIRYLNSNYQNENADLSKMVPFMSTVFIIQQPVEVNTHSEFWIGHRNANINALNMK